MMLKYDKYKGSGIEWLGDIPSHWSDQRIKWLTKSISVVISPKEFPEQEFAHYSLPSYDENQKAVNEYGWEIDSNKTLLVGGELLFAKLNPRIPRVWMIPFDEKKKICSGEFIPLDASDLSRLNLNYLKYLIFSDGFNQNLKMQVQSATKSHQRIRPNMFFDVHSFFPSVVEQTTIANYLDEKTAQIDKLIKNKQAQINRLKEVRQIEINNAVTKGLLAEAAAKAGLDPNIKLKPSGIEWLGDIPEHWEVKSLKKYGKLLGGFAFKSQLFLEAGSVKVLKITNIQTMNLVWDDIEFLSDEYYEKYYEYSVQTGDLVFALTRPIISTGIKAAIADHSPEDKILINQRTAVFKPHKMLIPSFLYFIVLGDYFFQDFNSKIKTTNQPNISTEEISRIKIVVPPADEQSAISLYLEKRNGKIDQLVKNIEKQIDNLKETRKIEIYNAVTGKIKVA